MPTALPLRRGPPEPPMPPLGKKNLGGPQYYSSLCGSRYYDLTAQDCRGICRVQPWNLAVSEEQGGPCMSLAMTSTQTLALPIHLGVTQVVIPTSGSVHLQNQVGLYSDQGTQWGADLPGSGPKMV